MQTLTLISKYSTGSITIRAKMGDEYNPVLLSKRRSQATADRAGLTNGDYWVAAVDESGTRCPVVSL